MESIRKQRKKMYLSGDQYSGQVLRGKGWSYKDINRYPSVIKTVSQILTNYRYVKEQSTKTREH